MQKISANRIKEIASGNQQSYLDTAKRLVQQGPLTLFPRFPQSLLRRNGTTGVALSVAENSSDNPFIKSSIATTIETLTTIALGEIKDKNMQYNGKLMMISIESQMAAATCIFVRNLIASGAMLGAADLRKKLLADDMINKISEQTGLTKEQIHETADAIIRGSMALLTTPADTFSTRLAGGETVANIITSITKNPGNMMRGAMARGGLLAVTGALIDYSKKNNVGAKIADNLAEYSETLERTEWQPRHHALGSGFGSHQTDLPSSTDAVAQQKSLVQRMKDSWPMPTIQNFSDFGDFQPNLPNSLNAEHSQTPKTAEEAFNRWGQSPF